jgi:hypothetical protein
VTSRSLNTSWSIFIEQLVNTFVKWYRKSGITDIFNKSIKQCEVPKDWKWGKYFLSEESSLMLFYIEKLLH